MIELFWENIVNAGFDYFKLDLSVAIASFCG